MHQENLQGQTFNGLNFLKLIGKGSFGVVYQVQSIKTLKKYAVKVQTRKTLNPQIHFQFDVYNYLHKLIVKQKIKTSYLPKIYGLFSNQSFTFLVMELLGQSFDKFLKQNRKSIKNQQILSYARKILRSIQFVHFSQFLYRDIKPQNFVLASSLNEQIFIIDFGLCKKISMSDCHKKKKHKQLIGTARYASLSSHQGKELSKKDDIQSFFYMLIYFLKGSLPWQGIKTKKVRTRNQQILHIKKKTLIQQLCQNLPKQIQQFGYYIKNIEAYEKLDYDYIDNLLLRSIQQFQMERQRLFNLNRLDPFQQSDNDAFLLQQQLNAQIINSKLTISCKKISENTLNKKSQNTTQSGKQQKHQNIQKSRQYESSQSQAIKSSNAKRKRKPLLKRQFTIRQQQQIQNKYQSEQSQSENEEEEQNSKFVLP